MSGFVTVREQIGQYLATRFTNFVAGNSLLLPDGTLYTTQRTWNLVTRRPLSKFEWELGSALAIFTPTERKIREAGFDRCHLQCILEFYDNVQQGDVVDTMLNAMLLDVQAVLYSDINCGGLSLDIVEVKSELTHEGPVESLMAGMLEVNIVYRHRAGNPCRNT